MKYNKRPVCIRRNKQNTCFYSYRYIYANGTLEKETDFNATNNGGNKLLPESSTEYTW